MKYFLILLSFIIISVTTNAQKKTSWSEIDTIKVFPEKTFVHYKTYQDSLLIQKADAFLYPTVLEISRFRFLRTIFKTKIIVDSIVFHGAKTDYISNRYFKTENYENGKLLTTSYFDSTGENISATEYHAKYNIRGPCGSPGGFYFIHGTKKVKTKK